MTDLWLFATGVANLAATPVYGYVGFRLYERPVSAAARLPALQFSLWWWGVGVSGAAAGIEGVLATFGALNFALGLTLFLLTVLADSVTLWGLVGYLVYLYTGRYYTAALSTFFAAFYVVTLYWVIASGPSGISVVNGAPTVTDSHLLEGPVLVFVLLGLIGIELVAIVLYASLLRRATDRTVRFRIATVSASLFLFFFIGLVPLSGSAWTFAHALIDVASALLALAAFFPPPSVQRLLGVTAVPRPGASDEVRTGDGLYPPG